MHIIANWRLSAKHYWFAYYNSKLCLERRYANANSTHALKYGGKIIQQKAEIPGAEHLRKYGINPEEAKSIIGNIIKEEMEIEISGAEEKVMEDASLYAIFDVKIIANGVSYPIKLAFSITGNNNIEKLNDYFSAAISSIEEILSPTLDKEIAKPFVADLKKSTAKFLSEYGNQPVGWYIEAGNNIYYSRYTYISIADKDVVDSLMSILKSSTGNASSALKDGSISPTLIPTGSTLQAISICKNMHVNLPSHAIKIDARSALADEAKVFTGLLLALDVIAAVDLSQRNIEYTTSIMHGAYQKFQNMMKGSKREDLPGYQ